MAYIKPLNYITAKWLVKYLIHTYFVNLKSTLILYDSGNRNELQNTFLEGIHEYQSEMNFVMQIINIHGLNQTMINIKVLVQVELATEGFISILENPKCFLEARHYAAQLSVQRIKDKYHLYLQDQLDVEKFFQSDELDLFPWHLVITKNVSSYEMWTQKFVGLNANKSPVLIESLPVNGIHLTNSLSNLYPDKIRNMMGRPVVLGTHNYKPYVMFKDVEPGKGNVNSIGTDLEKKDLHIFGSEGNICTEFCIISNCTLRVKNYGQDAWGELYPNGTSTGIVGGVWRKEVDLGIGSIYNWYNYEFEVANGIAKSAVRIMGPGPKRFPQYLTPVLPLPKIAWIMLLISMIFCSVVLNELRRSTIRLKTLNNPRFRFNCFVLSFLDVFAMFVQQTYSKIHSNGVGTRILLSIILITALTLENIYSGQLKSLLTVPLFEDPIDTTEKFAKMNFKWGAPAVAWEDSINESEIPKEMILAKNFQVHNVDALRKLTYTGEWGFAVEKLHSGGFTFGDYIRVDDKINLILLTDDVFYEFTRFIAIRGWPLTEQLNTFVLWIFESGIFLYWEKMYTELYLDHDALHYMIQSEQKFVPKPEPEILKLSHISGPLFALLFGYFLATGVLICEMLYSRFKNCD